MKTNEQMEEWSRLECLSPNGVILQAALSERYLKAEELLHLPRAIGQAGDHTGGALNEAFTLPDAQGTVRANKVINLEC